MANGLIAASMLSGFGQGVADAAKTGMQFVGASMLQRERQAMEDRRMQLMEQAAAAREQRGYDFQRGMAQERIGAEMVLKGQERQDQKEEKAAERDFTSTEKARDRESNASIHDQANETTLRGQDITAKHGQDTLDVTKRGQDLTAEHAKDQLAAQKQYYSAVERHYAAMERLSEAKTASARVNANKDLSETAKELANLEKAQGQDFMKMAADATLGEKERSSLVKQAQSHFDRAAMHLGYTGNETKVPDFSAIDPYKNTGASSGSTGAPPPSSVNRGEDYLASKKAEDDQRKDATRRDAMAAMNADAGLIANPDPAPDSKPLSPPSMPPMERQRPTGMQQSSDPVMDSPKTVPASPPVVANVPRELPRASTTPSDQYLQDKRDETAQREANIVQPSSGLVGSAMVGGSPKSSPPEIVKNVASEKTTGLDVFNAWTPAEREKASQLMEQVQQGKIDRDTFIAKIISMSDSGTKGLRLAEGMLRNMGLE